MRSIFVLQLRSFSHSPNASLTCSEFSLLVIDEDVDPAVSSLKSMVKLMRILGEFWKVTLIAQSRTSIKPH